LLDAYSSEGLAMSLLELPTSALSAISSEAGVSLAGVLAVSPQMREIVRLIRRIADRRSHVLIRGETGTGKERIAHAVHATGMRASGPFVPINCATLPEHLLESELFGHVKGAFTGAHETRAGLFSAASGGTLFLDEIGDMPPNLQAKLLRVLQDRAVRPVGATRSFEVDVRIVAATHRDLEREVEQGRFRPDLLYRLNVIPIQVPPLRERREDILPLAEHFVRKHAVGPPPRLSAAARRELWRRSWEGNARELENTIERALALGVTDVIRAEDLVPLAAHAERATHLGRELRIRIGMSIAEVERMLIHSTLEHFAGDRRRTAQQLGISVRTLYYRLRDEQRAD
jgi:two-component system NtrC family response regulator